MAKKKGGQSAGQPGKSAVQPGKQKKSAVHPLCLRCPDLNTARDPKDHTLEQCIKINPADPALWAGFPADNEKQNFDLNSFSPNEYHTLLQDVERDNKAAVDFLQSQVLVADLTEAYRKNAKHGKIFITKKILNHALDIALQDKAARSMSDLKISTDDDKGVGPSKGKKPAYDPAGTKEQIEAAKRFRDAAGDVQGIKTHGPSNNPTKHIETVPSFREEAKPTCDPAAVAKPAAVTVPQPTAIGSVTSFTPQHGSTDTGIPLCASLATPDDQTQVLTNHFTVHIPPKTELWEYHVTNIPSQATRSKKRMMILDMIEHDPKLWSFRAHIATDCQKKLISDVPLYEGMQEITINDFVPGSRGEAQIYKLQLKFEKRYQLDELSDYVQGRNLNYTDRGAADALNIVLSKAVTDGNNDTFQVGSNRFYYRAGWSNLEDGLVAIRGYFSSIKPAMGNILLNVNTVTSPFYKAQKVSEYLKLQVCNGKQKAEAHLGKRRVYVNFDRQADPNDPPNSNVNSFARRCKTIVEFGDRPTEQNFLYDGVEKTVWDHLRTKYPNDTPFEAKRYHSVNVGQKGGKNGKNGKYYMATQLDVLPGQPYNGQLSANATKAMIDVARRSPPENVNMIMGEGMTSLRLKNLTHPLIASMGITISQTMVTVPARKIANTTVQYGGRANVSTERGFWDVVQNDRYLTSSGSFSDSNSGSSAHVQYFLANDSIPIEQLTIIADTLERQWSASSRQRLQSYPDAKQRFITITDWRVEQLKEVLKNAQFHLAVLIFPSDSADFRTKYTDFRIVADQVAGIHSICINEKKVASSVRNANKRPGIPYDPTPKDYMRNFAMKINLRCGNTNHSINPAHLKVVVGNQAICDTMIIGTDVTHPGANSIPHAPSTAAVVGSVDNFFSQCPGSMRLNPSKQEWISEMKAMTLERLRLWSAKNGNTLPKRILYYRDGVGDSYFDLILQHEVREIESAWNTLRTEKQPGLQQKVQITAIVVTKRHHTRLYPWPVSTHLKLKDANCPPGTVVDSGITHPYYFDFYLQSHYIPKGTAKPSHYTVIRNDMNLSPKEVQDLTYHLCYTYGRSTTAVSYAPHAYYADRLCERGRLYLKGFFEKSEEIKIMLKKNDKWNTEEAAEEVMKKAEDAFYRHGKGKNPWHPNLDGKMFWM